MQESKESGQIVYEETTTPKEEQFQVLVKNKLTRITSSSTSPDRKHILITTDKGFILVNPNNSQFTRFETQASPFFKNQSTPHGARLGSILETRSEVALVPNFDSRRFCSTAVYIYDYSIKIILSTFDFILPIQQFSLTNRYLISSNNKRLILYNYLKGNLKSSQAQYIEAFHSNQSNDFIRYLQLDCHLYDPNNSYACECGNYSLTRTSQYLKVFFIKVSMIQNTKTKTLYCYDQTTDRAKPFEGMQTWTNDFEFTVTEDGKYLTIVEDYGRKIKVYNLIDNILQTVLHLGRQPRSIINLGIITLPNQTQWVIASREKQNDEATMHLFKLGKTSPTDHIESNYKRYFRLYKQFSVNEDIFDKDKFLGPEYYLIKERLFCLALEGQFCEIIDLNRAGLHERIKIKDYRRLEETSASMC